MGDVSACNRSLGGCSYLRTDVADVAVELISSFSEKDRLYRLLGLRSFVVNLCRQTPPSLLSLLHLGGLICDRVDGDSIFCERRGVVPAGHGVCKR